MRFAKAAVALALGLLLLHGIAGAQTPGLTILTGSPLPTGIVGSGYSVGFNASAGTSPYVWTLDAGALPPGLTLSPGGALGGTPTTAGSYSFTIRVTDSLSATATKVFSLTVVTPLTITSTSPLPFGVTGVAYSQTLSASGGAPPYTWYLSAGTLPPGLSLSSAGVISGTPTSAGAFVFDVTVYDQLNYPSSYVSKTFSITVATPLSILTISPLNTGITGTAYTANLAATGGLTPYVWSILSGALPPGLSLSPAGVISGTPNLAGTYSFIARVTDGSNQVVTRNYTIPIINPLSIATPSPLPPAVNGVPYSQAIIAAGGAPSYSWYLASGALPPNLNFSETGVISGTPVATGTYTFAVTVWDQMETSVTKTFVLVVADPLSITTTSPLPRGVTGSAYSVALTAAGGLSPFGWSVVTGALPPGLALSAAGVLSGTPTTAGTYTFTAKVSDGSNQTASRSYTVTIVDPLVITTASLAGATVGVAYSQTVTASGGLTPYSFAVSAGALPAGLSLTSAGAISGSPTGSGTFTFTVTVTDSVQTTASKSFSLVVAPPLIITTTTIADGRVSVNYSQPFAASGGRPPYSWSAGSLPAGLAMSSAGVLSGTPGAVGAFAFTVTVTDSVGISTSKSFAIGISPPPLSIITGSPLAGGRVGESYSQTFAATGGSPPYNWSTGGGLPPGLQFSPSGSLSGVPTRAGIFTLTVGVGDTRGEFASKSFQITIAPPPLEITTATPLGNGRVGEAYSIAFAAQGGVPPYVWSASGTPPGLRFSASGTLSGTPATAGAFTLTVTVQDSAQNSASKSFALRILPPPLLITTASLPEGRNGDAYSAALAASGGTPPYQWSAASLPPGLSMTTAGVITGSPSVTGSFSITVTVTDSAQDSASKSFPVRIVAPALVILTSSPLPEARVGQAYSTALAAAGGAPPYTWSVASAPAGLRLSAGGSFSGEPTAPGSFSMTVTVTDSERNAVSKQFALTVLPPPLEIRTTDLPSATAGKAYSVTLSAAGGEPPYQWSLVGGSLPPGVNLSNEGVMAGTPSATGSFRITVRVTDSQSATATRTFTLNSTLPPVPPGSVQGLDPNVNPAQQPRIDFVLGAPFPVTLTGRLTLTFTPEATNPADDPAVQFLTGGRTVNFTVPAGQTRAVFETPSMAIQTGTVAGRIVVTAQFFAEGVDVTPAPAPTQTATVRALAPVISAVRVTRTASGFEVAVTGFSTPRQMTQAVFRFTASGQGTLQTVEVTVPLDSAFTNWYRSSASAAFGSSFTYVQPFTVEGDISAISSLSVTLSNSQGASPAATVNMP